ncbi:MAG: hypothetical protein ACK41E_03465 [Deinococcales bacterium]
MQTFSQYAATRLLHSHLARAQTFGGVALQTGQIETFAGIDLITGMPVFIYTMPEQPQAIPEVYSETIPAVLEIGFEHGLGFLVTASAPGYTPLKPVLTQPRLEWLVRASSQALADAHSGGLQHGNLEPQHFFASGDHLLIEGWGLPWGRANPDYQAPETNISFATDIFSWARCISLFAKGKPRILPEGDFGRLIGHCLNPRPSERPTAQELVLALEQVLPPRQNASDLAQTALELSATEYIETERSFEQPIIRTKRLEIPVKPELPRPERPIVPPEPVQVPVLESAPTNIVPKSAVSSEIDLPKPTLEASDLASPEARLDAIEAELLPALQTNLSNAPLKHPEPEVLAEDLETAQAAELQESQLPESQLSAPQEPKSPESLHSKELISPILEQPVVIAQLSEPEHLAADEPDVALPSRASSRVTEDSDADAPRPIPIRIGFDEEDQSWRNVVTPPPRARPDPFVLIAVGIGVLIVVAGVLLGRLAQPSNPNPQTLNVQGNPNTGSVVIFTVRGAEDVIGRLIVESAPSGSNLAKGALLATVPGPVAFPKDGEYSLRLEIAGYSTAKITVRVPQEKQVNLELPR